MPSDRGVYLCVDRRSVDGRLQISIQDSDGGYRIAGPKYDGSGTNLMKHKLTPRDVQEIRAYLRQVEESSDA